MGTLFINKGETVTVLKDNNTANYVKQELYDEQMTQDLQQNFSRVLQSVGEDVSREGLLKTPERAAKAMQFLTSGYHGDPEAVLRSALFKEEYSEMVLVKDIELYSLCEHHLLPFIRLPSRLISCSIAGLIWRTGIYR